MKRYFYCKETDKWFDGYHQGDFTEDGTEFALRLAADLATPSLTVVDVADDLPDPRSANRFAEPAGPPPPKSPDAILKEDLEAATTILQLKAALLKRFGGV